MSPTILAHDRRRSKSNFSGHRGTQPFGCPALEFEPYQSHRAPDVFLGPPGSTPGSARARAMAADQSKGVAGGERVILVLDDDAAVRNSLKFSLGVEGFEVRTYSGGNELLNEASLPLLSCLVVDYHMPGMNGLDLVAKLRDRDISIPAILITVHPTDGLRHRAAAAGVPIVEKPFLGNQLLDCIRAALDGRRRSLQ